MKTFYPFILRASLSVGLSLSFLSAAWAQSSASRPVPLGVEAFDLRARHWGNLFYQLDCLASQRYCSVEAYRKLWQNLGWTPLDEEKLKAWRDLKGKYSSQKAFAPPENPARQLPPRFKGVQSWEKIRQAAMNAEDREALLENLNLLLRPEDAEALYALLQYFEDRFRPWWLTQGQKMAQRGSRRFAESLQKGEIPQLIQRGARFYAAELVGHSRFAFNFMARPPLGGGTIFGEQLENQSVVEVKKGQELAQLDVVIHELAHYLYERSPETQHDRLQAFFTAQKTPEAIAAYNLLNEVMATCLGNGRVAELTMSAAAFQRLLKRKGGLYNDPWIDPLARAFYPRFKRALLQGESLYSATLLRDYLTVARATLGPELQAPGLLLRTMGLAYSPDFASEARSFQAALRVGSAWGAPSLGAAGRQNFQRYPALSGLLMLKPEDKKALAQWKELLGTEALTQILQRERGVYGVKRPHGGAFIYVLMGSKAEMKAQIQVFSQQKRHFEGFLSSVNAHRERDEARVGV